MPAVGEVEFSSTCAPLSLSIHPERSRGRGYLTHLHLLAAARHLPLSLKLCTVGALQPEIAVMLPSL